MDEPDVQRRPEVKASLPGASAMSLSPSGVTYSLAPATERVTSPRRVTKAVASKHRPKRRKRSRNMIYAKLPSLAWPRPQTSVRMRTRRWKPQRRRRMLAVKDRSGFTAAPPPPAQFLSCRCVVRIVFDHARAYITPRFPPRILFSFAGGIREQRRVFRVRAHRRQT